MYSHSAPALCFPETSEARVSKQLQSCDTLAQSNTRLFKDAHRHLRCTDAHHGQLKTCQTCQSHVKIMPGPCQRFVQLKTTQDSTKTVCNSTSQRKKQSKRIEDTKRRYNFSLRGERSPGQSPVSGINYMQVSDLQNLQLASCALGRGLPVRLYGFNWLPTLAFSSTGVPCTLAHRPECVNLALPRARWHSWGCKRVETQRCASPEHQKKTAEQPC